MKHLVALDGIMTRDHRVLHCDRRRTEVPVIHNTGTVGRAIVSWHRRPVHEVGEPWFRPELWAETMVAVPPGMWLSPGFVTEKFVSPLDPGATPDLILVGASCRYLYINPIDTWPWDAPGPDDVEAPT